jgi:hypothetical protein
MPWPVFRTTSSTPAVRSPGASVAPDPRRGKMTRRGVTTSVVAEAWTRTEVPTGGGPAGAVVVVVRVELELPQEAIATHARSASAPDSVFVARPTRATYRYRQCSRDRQAYVIAYGRDGERHTPQAKREDGGHR